MQYRPALPEQNDNVSHNHPLREFVTLLTGVVGCLLAVFWLSGFLIDWAAGYISPEMETVIFSPVRTSGAAVFSGRSHDPRQTELQRLVNSLSPCLSWSHFLYNSISFNM